MSESVKWLPCIPQVGVHIGGEWGEFSPHQVLWVWEKRFINVENYYLKCFIFIRCFCDHSFLQKQYLKNSLWQNCTGKRFPEVEVSSHRAWHFTDWTAATGTKHYIINWFTHFTNILSIFTPEHLKGNLFFFLFQEKNLLFFVFVPWTISNSFFDWASNQINVGEALCKHDGAGSVPF